MRAQAMKEPADEGVATRDEVAAALAALTPADLAKLNSLAKLRACYAPNLDWRDLLHEAIDKLLAGRRKWPRHVPLLHFLREVMRSVASEARRRAAAGIVVTEADLPERADGETALTLAAGAAADADRALSDRQLLARVLGLFEGDSAALAVIDGLAAGLSPSQVQSAACISTKAYASAQKRIRRAIMRAFPEGYPS